MTSRISEDFRQTVESTGTSANFYTLIYTPNSRLEHFYRQLLALSKGIKTDYLNYLNCSECTFDCLLVIYSKLRLLIYLFFYCDYFSQESLWKSSLPVRWNLPSALRDWRLPMYMQTKLQRQRLREPWVTLY